MKDVIFDPLPGIFSGSVLKLAAILTMAIDHFAAGVLYFQLLYHKFPAGISFTNAYRLYEILRGIGRTAFPIYCFLLVEGLFHTRSRLRYLSNLLLFALLSEIPFDLALTANIANPSSVHIPELLRDSRAAMMEHQNVFFTLAIGLCAIWLIEALRTRFGLPTALIAAVPIFFGAGEAADLLKTDYHSIGIWLILALYLLHPIRVAAEGAGYLILSRLPGELWAFPGFVLMLFYSGKRGFLGRRGAAKYFFYIFYPAHLICYFFLRARLLK